MVKKCLAKDPDERWQSASDLASELNWIPEGGSQAGVQACRSEQCARGISASESLGHWRHSPCAPQSQWGHSISAILASRRGLCGLSIPPEEGTSILVTRRLLRPGRCFRPTGRGLAFVAVPRGGTRVVVGAGVCRPSRPGADGNRRSDVSVLVGRWPLVGLLCRRQAEDDIGRRRHACRASVTRPPVAEALGALPGTIVFSSSNFKSTLSQVPASGGTP